METVLIIEDSRPMQRTLQRLFEADSLGVRIASDGEEGLETFRHEPPNVVVLDLKLPGLSGKELCRSFKTEMPSVPIVVLSANADVDDKVVLLELGADDYVTNRSVPRNCSRACGARCVAPDPGNSKPRQTGKQFLRTMCWLSATWKSTSPAWKGNAPASPSA